MERLFEDAPFERRLAYLCEALGTDKRFVGEILGKGHKTAGLFFLLTHRAILDVVESVIGPEILVHPQFNIRAKMPGEAEVLWHQDIAFLDPEVEETFMINFWVGGESQARYYFTRSGGFREGNSRGSAAAGRSRFIRAASRGRRADSA